MRLPAQPNSFRAPGVVDWAHISPTAPKFHKITRRTGRRLQGVKYEAAVQEMLLERFPDAYLPSPWLYFRGACGVHWCQPDGLLFDPWQGALTIVEVKYQHTTDAWWQMRRLYEPVLRAMFPELLWEIHLLEIVKWFDPAVNWPEPLRMVADVAESSRTPYDSTGVHIWKP